MKIFEGKTSTERNKIIAAGILGVVSLVALYLAFFAGSSTTATRVTVTPVPKASGSPTVTRPELTMPSVEDQDFAYQTTLVNYVPGRAYAPDPGRNIFAFYEPPPPTPYVPPSPVPVVIKTPTPAPTPPLLFAFANPQNVYAGSRGFRLEVNGERFVPGASIYFNQVLLPTTFVNANKLIADVSANMIAQEGQAQIIVQTPDGKLYSNPGSLAIQEPPKPGLQYIGMIGRARYNNDTAYFTEANKPTPFGARLNDVLGRFRLIDISPAEVVFEDTTLGFRHRLAIVKASGNPGTPGKTTGRGSPPTMDGGFMPFNPQAIPQGDIPGIPANIPRYVPPPPPAQMDRKREEKKEDVDDDDPYQ